jgi:hypothetical protein
MKDETSYHSDARREEFVVPIGLLAGSGQEYVEDGPVCCRSAQGSDFFQLTLPGMPGIRVGLAFGAAQGIRVGGERVDRAGAVIKLIDVSVAADAAVVVGPFAALFPSQ